MFADRLHAFRSGVIRAWRRLQAGEVGSAPSARAVSTSKPPADSAHLPKEPNSASPSILEQALQQIYSRTGVDAWEGYVHRAHDSVSAEKLQIKAIAFYSSDFYIDRAPGSFTGSVTPWTNISEALPRYLGHYQPHRPGELGFYDQRLPEVLSAQIDLARQYGIYGFCFHYYFSEGRKLRELPLAQFLSNPNLNIRFCICWRNGDGTNSSGDEAEFIESLKSVFADPRYIRINGRPLLVVYRPANLSNAHAAGKHWRSRAKEMGFPDLYLVGSRAVECVDPRQAGFDAAVEYPPHETSATEMRAEFSLIDPDFSGHIYDYQEVLTKHIERPATSYVCFKSVMPSWDDEPRRAGNGTSFAGSTPALFGTWLNRSCQATMSREPEERFLFINGWNNWLDGAHLEPDRKFGYAYLQVTANILRLYQDVTPSIELIQSINAAFVRRNQAAVIFHCHYEDLLGPILEKYLAPLSDADLFVTVHPDISRDAVEQIRKSVTNVYFLVSENRGRDVRSFMLALKHIASLGYPAACKIHTKKTPQAESGFGDSWRERLINSLVASNDYVYRALERFSNEPDLGILAPAGSLMDLSLAANHIPNTFWLDRLLRRLNRSDLIGSYSFGFPAGSMFWFRVRALDGFSDLFLTEDGFEPEIGQRDGTLAHAAERLVSLYAQEHGFCTREL